MLIPTPRKTVHAFFNGEILPFDRAHLALNDIGILRGYGVCDVARTRNRKPFVLERHLVRFRTGADRFRIRIPYSDRQLEQAITDLVQLNTTGEASIKMIATGGVTLDGTTFNPETPTVYIMVSDFTPLPEHYFSQGVKLITHQYQRPFPETKSLNYITMVEAQPLRDAASAFELLYADGDYVREAATSNVFMVKGGTVTTPDTDILAGISRSLALELIQASHAVEERLILLKELLAADEVFLTATNKDILPVVAIDAVRIGNGTPGSVTTRLLKQFRSYANEST